MDNLSELIGLYGLDSLPRELQKQRELKRWRDIMAQQRYEQDDLPGYLEAEAKARESDIDKEAFIRHKQAMAKRWFGYYRKCKDPRKKVQLAQQYNLVATMNQR